MTDMQDTGTNRRNGRTWLKAILVLLAIALAGGGWWGVSQLRASDGEKPRASETGEDSAGPQWHRAEARSFPLTVNATGELEAASKVELKSKVEGQTTIVEVIDEGTFVEEGEILIRLADEEIREKIEQEEISVEQARADMVSAEQDFEIEKSETDSAAKAAAVKLRLAELELKKWEAGDVPKKRRELKLAVETARRTLTRSKRDLKLSEQLYEEKFISLSELEDDQIAVIEAENTLASAELDIEVYEKFTHPKEEAKFTSDVDQARAELDRTKRKNQSRLAQASAKLDGKRRQLKLREERLAKLQEQLEYTVMRAPQEGMVVYASSVGNRRWRNDPIAQGRNVRFNETLIILPDTSKMVASLRVHEAMVNRVKPGQSVVVTLDSSRGQPVEGAVEQVSVMAEDGGWINPQLREYEVRVALSKTNDGTMKPAMRCSGQIMTGRVEDAVAIPVQAVHVEGRDRFVYMPDGGERVRRQPVKVGQSSSTLVEIREGLTTGDRVLLRRPRPGELQS